ncbi:hypothetical protein [Acidimangrovimonas sediminis]|uniref:hypothetical protein n=1 Tax=Acidimangrovimonas sediminis TaxID=2056283 RepID=UPI000C80774B|nr:hypothetical protein [Acidimangrovimonas sediminis]
MAYRLKRAVLAGVWGICALGLPASRCLADAWPREVGGMFVSTGVTFGQGRDATGHRSWAAQPVTEGNFYAEIGLKRDNLVILDATLPKDGGSDFVLGFGHATQRDDGTAWGWALGVGRRTTPGAAGLTYLRPALAWGRGWGAGGGDGRLGAFSGVTSGWPGWVTAKLELEVWARPRQAVPKIDVIFGLKPSERVNLMLELLGDDYPGARASLRLGPAVVLRVGSAQVKLQPEIPLIGESSPRISLALWSAF